MNPVDYCSSWFQISSDLIMDDSTCSEHSFEYVSSLNKNITGKTKLIIFNYISSIHIENISV